jgi:hypothetical protein
MTWWITPVAVAVATTVAGQPANPPTGQPVASEELRTFEAESFQVRLPRSWEQQDLSNQTFLSPTPKDVRAHFRRAAPGGGGASVLFQYIAAPAPEEAVSAEWMSTALEDGSATMAALPPEEVRYFVQDKGHGCFNGFELVDEPQMVATSGDPGRHLAFDYEYACSSNGVPIRGWAWVAFSPDGRKHNIFMTAPEDVWGRDVATLQEVAASIGLPEGSPEWGSE